jgi:DNA-binding NarL/FixJ family response regulator
MRVLLATDHPDLGDALHLFLAEQSIELVDVVDCARNLSSRAAACRADVVIVDSRLTDALSAGLVADLRTGRKPTPVVLLVAGRHQGMAQSVGADALAMLGDPPDALVAALVQAAPGRSA